MFQIKSSGNTQIKVELLLFNESALNWLSVHLDQGAKHKIISNATFSAVWGPFV